MTDKELFNCTFCKLHIAPEKKTEILEIAKNRYTQRLHLRCYKLRVVFATVVCLLLLTACGIATGAIVNSPSQAWRVAKTEFAKLQELNIISGKITLDSESREILEDEEWTGNDYWFGRIFKHCYHVRCNSKGDNNKYFVNMAVDTASGKIMCIWIQANPDADEPVDESRAPYISEKNEIMYYYRNFHDIFPEDLTLDCLCSKLAEYWGFSDYTISSTTDSFYGYDTAVPDSDLLLKDICNDPYITVYFEGDQSGVPMYVELLQFPEKLSLSIGTRHSIG